MVGSTTTLEFLGIMIKLDMDMMEVRVLEDKVVQLELLLDQWAAK